jgi:hypothetical protein
MHLDKCTSRALSDKVSDGPDDYDMDLGSATDVLHMLFYAKQGVKSDAKVFDMGGDIDVVVTNLQ